MEPWRKFAAIPYVLSGLAIMILFVAASFIEKEKEETKAVRSLAPLL